MTKIIQQKASNKDVIIKMAEVYSDLFSHDGYGDFRVEIKILRRGQKEVIIHCGKQHRFLIDYQPKQDLIEAPIKKLKMIEHEGAYVGPDRRSNQAANNKQPRVESSKNVAKEASQ